VGVENIVCKFRESHKKIFDYITKEIKIGHKDYSAVSATEVNVDPREYRKACLDLKGAGIIKCQERYGSDDELPISIYNIYPTELVIAAITK